MLAPIPVEPAPDKPAIDVHTGAPVRTDPPRPAFTGERYVPGATDVEPTFQRKMYQEHLCRYLFASQFVAGKRVLDVACGVGYGSAILAAKGAESVLGIDVAPEAIAFAEAGYAGDRVRFLRADARAVPVPTAGFDVVVAFECVEHIEDPDRLFSEVRRVLKRDGLAIISTPRGKDGPRSSFHAHEFSIEEFRESLGRHFGDHRLLVEQNLFIAQIDEGHESEHPLQEIIARQDVEGADYFVALAGRLPDHVESSRVLNDDAYVLTLEKDVGVLRECEERMHRDEDILRNRVAELEAHTSQLRDELERARGEIDGLRSELKGVRADLDRVEREREEAIAQRDERDWWVNHYRKMTPRPAYLVLRSAYLARKSATMVAHEGPRAFLDRAARFVLERIGNPPPR